MYNQLSRYGAIAKALPATTGKIFWVLNSDDKILPTIQEMFPTDEDGVVRVYTSLESAYAALTTNEDDCIILGGHGEHAVDAMVTFAKNRIHLYGIDWLLGIHRDKGQSSRVTMGITTAATDLATGLNTGVRNSFKGIKFQSANTKAESLYTFIDAGEYTDMEDCEIYKSTDFDVTGSAELVCNSDSAIYTNCFIGTTVTTTVGAIIRANVLFTKGIVAGKQAVEPKFLNCTFAKNCGNTADRFIYGASADAITRSCYMKECIFWNNAAAAAIPAQNIAFGASLTVGSVLLHNCSSNNAATAMSTTTGVFVDGTVADTAKTGIPLQTT